MNAYFRLKNRVKQKLNEIEKKHIVLCTASKQGAVAQVRGQLDDQDSQKTEIYGSRGRENAWNAERRPKDACRAVQGWRRIVCKTSNEPPGRKYVVSWMTKTVRIVNVQVKGTLERREMRNDDQETHTRRQTRRRNASTRLARWQRPCNSEIYKSRDAEARETRHVSKNLSSLKRVKTSLRHLQGCSKVAHGPMQDD